MPHCRELPSGKFIGMITTPLLVYSECFMQAAATIFLYRVSSLQTMWNSQTVRGTPPHVKCYSYPARTSSVSKYYISPVGQPTGSLSASFQKNCLPRGSVRVKTPPHWSVSLWRDPDDVSHCRILSPDKTERWLISATLCGWRRCFVADQLWLMKRIREEDWSDRVRSTG